MKKYKSIVFDFDNTLFDSTTWFVEFTKEFIKNTRYNDWDYRDFYNELNTLTGTSANVEDAVSTKFWRDVKDLANYKLFPEDVNAIEVLHGMGIKMGICSRSKRSKIEKLLVDFKIEKYFSVIVDGAQKPDIKYLLSVINQLGINPNEVLYVGDELEDVELGFESGVDTAYLLRSHEHFQQTYKIQKHKIDQLNPKYKISNLYELIEIVNGNN